MGLMTLDDFMSDIQSILGDGFNNGPMLTRWVNYGYQDVATSVDHEQTTEEEEIETEALTQTIIIPDGTWLIESIQDLDNDVILGWIPRTEMKRRSLDALGSPTHWHRIGSLVYLHPIPDDAYTLYLTKKIKITQLANETDVTVLDEMWDQAIFLISVSHALMARSQRQAAGEWLARGIMYIQSRITGADFGQQTPGLASSIGLDKLTQRLNLLQSGGQ